MNNTQAPTPKISGTIAATGASGAAGYLTGAGLLVLSVIFRAVSFPIQSADYTSSLAHWMDALRGSPGLSAFSHIFSDYPPLYLYFLKIITLLPGYDLYWIKTLSCLFDLALAGIIATILYRTGIRGSRLFLSFCVVLAVPTFLVNSSLWGQCDVIYAAFVLLSLYFILRNRPLTASLAFGVAISLKLQAVFFLPVLLGYLFARRRGWLGLLIIPAVFLLTLIPAIAAGGPLGDLLFTYVRQAGEFSQLSLSAPSAFVFFSQGSLSATASGALSLIGYLAALAVAVFVAISAYRRTIGPEDPAPKTADFIQLSLISVLVIPFFLPHMHERYFYLADACAVLYALYHPKRAYIAVIVVVSSFFSYMPFLSGQVPLFQHLLVNLDIFGAALFALTLILLPRLFYLGQGRPDSRIRGDPVMNAS